jgi:hypothetical protein
MADSAARIDFDEAAAPATPAAAQVRLYAKSDGLLYSKDDAGTETLVSGGAGGGGGNVGNVLAAVPASVELHVNGGAFNAAADYAAAYPLHVPGPMYVRAAVFEVGTAGAGALEWGLFDYSANPAAATKIAGGSAVPGGTGWQAIAASGAPVLIDGGEYMLVWKQPASGGSTLRYNSPTVASIPSVVKERTGYTWDNTPDFTSGWSLVGTGTYKIFLVGDLGASNQW